MKEYNLDAFSEKTEISLYFDRVQNMIQENKKNVLYREKYYPIIEKNKKFHHSVFLSVIVRTQGKRTDGLREALLCLQAQTCQDFEIILIGHKLDSEQKSAVKAILDEQEATFQQKIRFFELNEGGRAVPLNFGFANAYGDYVAIYDDDDILFSNWVESFKSCATNYTGRILHSYAFSPNPIFAGIHVLSSVFHTHTFVFHRAEKVCEPQYCFSYDLISQLSVNKCPLMTLAFPVEIFHLHGFIFDESLNVTEDWDYFMRTSFLCGVTDIPTPTAIYRFWENAESSSTVHNEDEWVNTYKTIQASFENQTILLHGNNIKRLIDLSNTPYQSKLTISEENTRPMFSKLYYSKNNSFNESDCLITVNEVCLPKFDNWFLFHEKSNSLQGLRFDLTENGLFLLDNIEIVVWFTNGEKQIVSLDQCVHNGIEYNNKILFFYEDPQIIWDWNDERFVDVVHISGEISNHIVKKKIYCLLDRVLMFKNRKKVKNLRKKGLL